MNPKEINQATDALVKAVAADAVKSGQNVEDRVAAIAPGLAGGSNIPRGYMYERNVGTTVPALTANLVSAGKQNVLKAIIRDKMYGANKKYEDSQFAYRKRQRDYQREQAKKNRQAKARAAAASFGSGGVTYGPTSTGVNGVNVNGSASRPTMTAKNGKNGAAGYSFTDATGKPISAQTYANLVGLSWPTLLQKMAQSGDMGAKVVMTQSNNSSAYGNNYRALTWK